MTNQRAVMKKIIKSVYFASIYDHKQGKECNPHETFDSRKIIKFGVFDKLKLKIKRFIKPRAVEELK